MSTPIGKAPLITNAGDILETIKVSQANNAAMVCGMDWAEHNGFFIFSDR